MAFREVLVTQVVEVLRAWLAGQGKRPAARRAGVDVKTTGTARWSRAEVFPDHPGHDLALAPESRRPQGRHGRGPGRARLGPAQISWLIRGRPGRLGYVHLRVISRRCHASNVPGVTSRQARCTVGSGRASAARMARSAQSGLAGGPDGGAP